MNATQMVITGRELQMQNWSVQVVALARGGDSAVLGWSLAVPTAQDGLQNTPVPTNILRRLSSALLSAA